jgi:hypothetical protein
MNFKLPSDLQLHASVRPGISIEHMESRSRDAAFILLISNSINCFSTERRFNRLAC